MERATPRESTIRSERPSVCESTKLRERAIFNERTMLQERAKKCESTRSRERANTPA